MKKQQDNKTTYVVGFLRGAVYDKPSEDSETGAADHVKRGEVRADVNVNKSAIFQATNRGRILGTSKDDKKAVDAAIEAFKAEIKEEDKQLKQYADEQLANSANLAGMVKNLQAELAELRKRVA